jgi:hypothetical protein
VTLLVMALFLGAANAAGQALDSKAVKKAVEEYVDPASGDSKRASLLDALGKAKNSDISAALKREVKKDDKRKACLDLALALHVRGQYSTFDKYFSEDAAGIAKLGLITADKGSDKDLQKHWADAAVDSNEFKALNDAFEHYGSDLDALAEFEKVLEDDKAVDEKRTAAAEILKFQFGLDTADPTEISLRWSDLQKEYKDDGQRFSMTGMDILALDGWTYHLVRRIGANLKFDGNNSIARMPSGLPASFKTGDYTVTVHARVEADFDGDVGLLLDVGGSRLVHGMSIADGKWSMNGPKGKVSTPIKPGKWSTFTLTSSTVAGAQEWSYAVDGKVVADKAHVNGELVGFVIQCRGGKAIFGSLDYNRN